MRRIAISILVLGVSAAGVLAQSGDPEYFRITGLKTDDNVNVRRQPNADAKIAGKIPKDADGVKNLGCNRGGLTEKQWDKASAAKKKDAERRRWCEVEYKGVKGWVSARFLTEGSGPKQEQPVAQTPPSAPQPQFSPPPQIASPSFDCAKAEKNAEKLVCGDNELAVLDREVARLYVRASEALNAMPGFETLLDSQRKWLDQRNTCFDRDCVAEMYVRRMHQLRMGYADARKPDEKSISFGPLVARCEGVPVPLAVTFANSEPGFVYLEWADRFLVLPHVPAGSGARYEGSFASFHTQDQEALVKLPNAATESKCKLAPGG